MLSRPAPISRSAPFFTIDRLPLAARSPLAAVVAATAGMMRRRWRRERRRRQVGRAFDMAVEVAHLVPRHAQVLDVGCGNGFIAHHLSALLGTSVVGVDLGKCATAPITYLRYDGIRFPTLDESFDAVLFCYVLHHAQDVGALLSEARRVLRDGGLAIVYEDIPQSRWDRAVCWAHDRQWRQRTGPCTFRGHREWLSLFAQFGFQTIDDRVLSRWRNLTHPVSREYYVLRLEESTFAQRL